MIGATKPKRRQQAGLAFPPEVIAHPTMVLVNPIGLQSYTMNALDYVAVTGGNPWVPQYQPGARIYDNPMGVVVSQNGVKRAIPNVQQVTVSGGMLQAKTMTGSFEETTNMGNITHDVDHYEIGAGDRFEIGAGQRFEIGDRGPSISEDAFPQDISLGAGDRLEIGAEETQAAVRQVIVTARDNRQPPPKMRAVPVEAPVEDDAVSEWFADVAYDTGVVIGAENPFPLMTKLLTRFGAGQEKPRYVRVDTEESYPQFIAGNSPEMAEMQGRLADVAAKLDAHVRDPNAHGDPVAHEELLEAIDEAEMLGAEAAQVEASKDIDMWLPEWAKGKIRAWREGDFICVSMSFPGADGELRICTSMTLVARAVEEMERHAASANVSAAAIVGVLPAMGCVLGAGTLVKEMAAAAPSILQRPEAARCEPFMCRIEPKANPALCAFVALLQMCARGDKQACAEWDALASAAGKGAPYAAQAMQEAKGLFLKACKAA